MLLCGHCPLDGGEVLEGQGLRADAGIKARRLDGGDDFLLWQAETAGDGVGYGLAALAKGRADEGEITVLILHLHGRGGADVHPHDGAGDFWGRA